MAIVFCDICAEYTSAHNVRKLACGITWCKICITKIFEQSIAQSRLGTRPRCCQQVINASDIAPLLDAKLRHRWDQVQKEWASRNPIYCLKTSGTNWIKPSSMSAGRTTVKCKRCGIKACFEYRQVAADKYCSEPEGDDKKVKKLAKQLGWSQCWKCYDVISEDTGCSHIKCTCGVEFCHACQTPYERSLAMCTCELYFENIGNSLGRNINGQGHTALLEGPAVHPRRHQPAVAQEHKPDQRAAREIPGQHRLTLGHEARNPNSNIVPVTALSTIHAHTPERMQREGFITEIRASPFAQGKQAGTSQPSHKAGYTAEIRTSQFTQINNVDSRSNTNVTESSHPRSDLRRGEAYRTFAEPRAENDVVGVHGYDMSDTPSGSHHPDRVSKITVNGSKLSQPDVRHNRKIRSQSRPRTDNDGIYADKFKTLKIRSESSQPNRDSSKNETNRSRGRPRTDNNNAGVDRSGTSKPHGGSHHSKPVPKKKVRWAIPDDPSDLQ